MPEIAAKARYGIMNTLETKKSGHLGRQGAVAEVLAKYPAGKNLVTGGKRAEEQRLEGWKGRNRSWADIYTLHKEESRLAASTDISASSRLNHLLTSRLQSSSNRLSAFQSTFSDLIQALPSHSLLLQRLKSGYEEVLSHYQSKLTASARLQKDVEDMMELQQLEKETLLRTIRELKTEVGELNGALLRKTAKIAEVERRVVQMMVEREEAGHSDPSGLTTQKHKSSPVPIMSPSIRSATPYIPPKPRPTSSQPDQPMSSLDILSPIGREKEAFVSDQEVSRAEIKESMPRPARK
jgi:chromosome segregation ATPase